jgi:hypothetical protein
MAGFPAGLAIAKAQRQGGRDALACAAGLRRSRGFRLLGHRQAQMHVQAHATPGAALGMRPRAQRAAVPHQAGAVPSSATPMQ